VNQQRSCQYIEEDEIDLRELFKTIVKYKKFISVFVVVVTFFAGVYAFLVTPIYQVKGLLEIGSYKSSLLDSPQSLKTKLDVIFIKQEENIENKKNWIQTISIPKSSKEFLEIVSEGFSNQSAEDKLNQVVKYIQDKHQEIIDDIKTKNLKQISYLSKEIESLKTIDLSLNSKNLKKAKEDLEFYKKNLKQLSKEFNKIKNRDSTFALLILTQQKNIQDIISKLENRIDSLIKEKNSIFLKIDNLNQKIQDIKDSIKPYNLRNTQIVGNIIKQDYPVKPKRALIIIVAFITSFILAIFLVFFIEFIKDLKTNEVEFRKETS